MMGKTFSLKTFMNENFLSYIKNFLLYYPIGCLSLSLYFYETLKSAYIFRWNSIPYNNPREQYTIYQISLLFAIPKGKNLSNLLLPLNDPNPWNKSNKKTDMMFFNIVYRM